MPQIRESRKTRVVKNKELPAVKVAASDDSYIDANGVKVTMCKPGKSPKQLAARCQG